MKSFIFCRNILGRQTLIWKINPMGLGEKTLTISHKPSCNPFKIPMLRVEQGAVKQTGGSWWHDLLSGHYQRQLGPLWPQKRGGKSGKNACQQSSCLCLKEQDFAGCAEISWGSLLSNRPWKGHVTSFFFLSKGKFFPEIWEVIQILISSWISKGCSFAQTTGKGCCALSWGHLCSRCFQI